MKEALSMRARQGAVLRELTATFRKETIDGWKLEVETWVRDKKGSPDPYEDSTQGNIARLMTVQ